MVVGVNKYWRSIIFRSGKIEEVLWSGIALDIWRKLWILKWEIVLSLRTFLAEWSVCTRELYPMDAVYFPGQFVRGSCTLWMLFIFLL